MVRPTAVFVSYRRADTKDAAGRLYDKLESEFGRSLVFKDVDSIPDGVPFADYIATVLGKCKVALALIGPDWLEQRNKDGTRRLDDPKDLVRVELETAIHGKVHVIPVLVNEARMPAASDLPESLRPLAALNAARLRGDPDFRADAARLVHNLRTGVMRGAPHPQRWTRRLLLVGAAAGAVTAGAFALRRPEPDESDLPIPDGIYLVREGDTSGAIQLPVRGGEAIWVSPTPMMERGGLRRAVVAPGPYDGMGVVRLELNDIGAAQMRVATAENVGRRLALVSYGAVIWDAVIQSPLSSQVELSGNHTTTEAQAIADRLNRTLR